MIDLHSHLLPACDDGAGNVAIAIEMARIAVADGTRVMACTPHIFPGIYFNDAVGIAARVAELQATLVENEIDLKLVVGADVHIAPDLPQKLADGSIPTLNGSRYFLLEPPHHVAPPNLVPFVERVISTGFIPIVTHPERLTWVERQYDIIEQAGREGALIQVTAGSLLGQFGDRAKRLASRLLEEKRVDLVASDAHNVASRSPRLSQAFSYVSEQYGDDIARRLFIETPKKILTDQDVVGAGRSDVRRPIVASDKLGVASRLWKHLQGKKV